MSQSAYAMPPVSTGRADPPAWVADGLKDKIQAASDMAFGRYTRLLNDEPFSDTDVEATKKDLLEAVKDIGEDPRYVSAWQTATACVNGMQKHDNQKCANWGTFQGWNCGELGCGCTNTDDHTVAYQSILTIAKLLFPVNLCCSWQDKVQNRVEENYDACAKDFEYTCCCPISSLAAACQFGAEPFYKYGPGTITMQERDVLKNQLHTLYKALEELRLAHYRSFL